MNEFLGFPPQMLSFFERLPENNTKEFWNEHKNEWIPQGSSALRAAALRAWFDSYVSDERGRGGAAGHRSRPHRRRRYLVASTS